MATGNDNRPKLISIRPSQEQRERFDSLLVSKQSLHRFLREPDFIKELIGFTNNGIITEADRARLRGQEVISPGIVVLGLLQTCWLQMSSKDQEDMQGVLESLANEVNKRARKHQPNSGNQDSSSPQKGRKKAGKSYEMLAKKTA
jgi:hypothetical protein